MELHVICPCCKKEFDATPSNCDSCFFPFNGTEQERGQFIGQHILKKGKVNESVNSIKVARTILVIIGIVNILEGAYYLHLGWGYEISFASGFSIGAMFITFAYLSIKEPFISILIPLILLIVFYIFMSINYPIYMLHGLFWKVICTGLLTYSLITMQQAKTIKKNHPDLNQ